MIMYLYIKIPLALLDVLNGLKISLSNGFIAIVVSLTVYKTVGQLVRNAIGNSYIAAFAAQLIFAVPVFIAVIFLKKTDIYHTDINKLKKRWTAGLLFLLRRKKLEPLLEKER